MFANTLPVSGEESAKAQKSQKERQRRERENALINRLKQILLSVFPNNPFKLEKADILEQTVHYISSLGQNVRMKEEIITKMEETIRQQSNCIERNEEIIRDQARRLQQYEYRLRDVMSAGLLQASPSSEESFSPDRMIRSEILYDDSINSSPTNTSSDDMDCSSVEMSPVGLMISGNTTPHLPRKHNLPRNISSKSESVWHPWE